MIPYYYYVKLAFFVFLIAPKTKGALTIYNSFVKELLTKYKPQIESFISEIKGAGGELVNEAKNKAAKEINNP